MAERQPGEVLILLSRVMKKKRKRRKKWNYQHCIVKEHWTGFPKMISVRF